MQLGQHHVSTLRPPPVLSIDFSPDGRFFAVATETGYEVWRSCPLGLVRRRELAGTLARALILPDAPLIALQGGGKSPLYPPNKVVIYHDRLGLPLAELEFGVMAYEYGGGSDGGSGMDRALGSAIATAATGKDKGKEKEPSSSVAVPGGKGAEFWIRKLGEWETAINENGLMAIASDPGSTLLAIPGRQPGHVQLISLPPCRASPSSLSPTLPPNLLRAEPKPPSFRSPIILAHTHALSYLSTNPSGAYLITTSERGTLVRVWDTARGRLDRELRRGVDRAEMWGAVFEGGGGAGEERRKGGRVVGWSDKGTIHVWEAEDELGAAAAMGASRSSPGPDPQIASSTTSSAGTTFASLLTRTLPSALPLPKYFSSPPSAWQYHLPRKNPHAFASTFSAAAEVAGVPSMKMREAAGGDRGAGEWSGAGGRGAGEGSEEGLGERFVVGWVDVLVQNQNQSEDQGQGQVVKGGRAREELHRPIGVSRAADYRHSVLAGGPAMAMGAREERRSSGSEATARSTTATPTLGPGSGTGKGGTARNTTSTTTRQGTGGDPGRGSGTRHAAVRTTTATATAMTAPGPRVDTAGQAARVRARARMMEKQLVAITYSGDWYLLRIPDRSLLPAATQADPRAFGSGSGSGSGRRGSESEPGVEGEKASSKCELVEYRRLNVGGKGGW